MEKKFNKIFQIGFNRCATTAIHIFFEKNGLKSVHWDKSLLAQKIHKNHLDKKPLLEGYEEYDCFTDMESAKDNIFIYLTLFKELDKQYPNSKFILNIRNIDDWIKSRVNHWGYLKFYQDNTGFDNDEIITLWRRNWEDHILNVKNYFNNRPNDLIVFDIDNESEKFVNYIDNLISLKNKSFHKYNKTIVRNTKI